MRTRTLLLLSLGCGLAILLAGIGMVWRLSTQDGTATAPIGQPTVVGDMTVTVVNSVEGPSGDTPSDGSATPSSSAPVAVEVTVRLEGPPDDEPARNFNLLVDGENVSVDSSDCPALTDDPIECVVSFRFAADAAGARLLSYRRGEQRAVWVLPRGVVG